MRRLASALVIAAGATACSLVVSTSGLYGGDEARIVTPEGGQDDGSMRNESGGADAAADAPPMGVESGPPSPCAQAHLFCDDFETGNASDVLNRWTSSSVAAGPLSLVGTVSRSPPRSLRVSVTPGNGARISQLSKYLVLTAARVRVEIDVLVGTPSSNDFGEVDVVQLGLDPPPSGLDYHEIAVAMYMNVAQLEYSKKPTGGMASTDAKTITVPREAWSHLALTVDFKATPATATLEQDGVVTGSIVLLGSALTGLTLSIGATYTMEARVDWPISFDDVVVDYP